MHYDHCRFCGKTTRLSDFQVSCSSCHEKIELELLKRTYWTIHEMNSDFVRPEHLLTKVMPVRDKKLDLTLLRNWALRGHLVTDVFGRLGVPNDEFVAEAEGDELSSAQLLRRLRGGLSALPSLGSSLRSSPQDKLKDKRAVA
ncbi:MAG: hypothetical protein ABIH23_01410 [bacterium]